MRILNVTESYVPFDEFGGPPVKVRALSEELAARGHEVTVLTADWGLEKRLKELRETESTERCPFGWRRKTAGVCAIYLPTWLHYRAVTWNPAVKRFCRARLQNFDVAHIFGLYDLLGPAVARFCRKRSVPYVVEPIGMFTPIVRNLRMKRIYHTLYGKHLFREAEAVIVTSEQEREALLTGEIPRDKILLRRNGVTFPKEFPKRGVFRAANAIPATALVVLFLGRLSAKKSPDLLLEAFATLPRKIRETEVWLVFAGRDEAGMKNRLEHAANRLGVAPRVQFTGAVFGEQKWSAYRDADVFVLPSQNENFGNAAAEAAAAGTPVIVTEHCGIASLLGDGAAMIIPRDAAALRNAMESVLQNTELRENLSRAGVKAATRLGWGEPVQQMETVYARLAASVPHGGQSDRQE